MQRLYTVLFLVAIMQPFMACENKKKPIEELLDRKGPISTTTEWINTKAAIRTLQDDIRRKPNNEKKKLMLALAYMQEARITGEHPHYYPLAQDLLDEVISSNPQDKNLLFEALVAKATVQLSLHQFEEALNTGMIALKIDSTTASLYGVFCDAYVELGDYPRAIEAADRMTSIRPDIRSYSRISYLREIHGDVPGAIEAMKEAILSGMPGLEQTAWARITLGGLYETIGQLDEAEMQYNMALAERPQYPFAIGSLGRLEAKKKNYVQAIELLKKASDIIPEFSFQQELASVYKVTGEKNKAKSMTEELLESLQEDQEAGHIVNLEIANIHLDITEDLDEAYSFAKKEYRKRPENIDVCKTMASIAYRKNNLEEAGKLIEKASRTNKQDAELISLKGFIAYKSGDQEIGLALMNKALQLDPFLDQTVVNEINGLTKNKLTVLHEK
jgi:tetratricopeptide (TPR) repeat protein